ncbi:hypothetical protein HYE59_05385 [Aggregatibacter actinomycetemcomitans]|uniref:hypothetical protein n=1 Tax=Aggregatibacter actinomycetemcomitans TaxID=714 RepID=UPI00197B35A9|nr:hypothetical protein [Aggregatibacter actinomycetemcomitans]MBN6076981.1 hypothetical protein [Aggregatibacter actinomycetemcomitans]
MKMKKILFPIAFIFSVPAFSKTISLNYYDTTQKEIIENYIRYNIGEELGSQLVVKKILMSF